MADTETRTTASKALKTNLDLERYGAFAEIGAGQEVARHYFVAGRASQTIAKSMSAYDMTYSDEIYGREKNGRYVCESRLLKMLEKESQLLIRRLDEKRGAQTAFFSFANTVATGTPETPKCHGWMGVRFQAKPRGEFNEVVMHVRMMDRTRLQQQDSLGILGVNLLDAAFYLRKNPEQFLAGLMENLKPGQVVLDVVKFSGPDFAHFDNRRFNLELVRQGFAEAVLFAVDGSILSVADAVYGKPLLIQRGTFRPLTVSHVDVLNKGLQQLKREAPAEGTKKTDPMTLLEMVMHAGTKAKELDDFLQRVDLAATCGYPVLVSNFKLYYQLKRFFRKHTQQPLALVVGASKLDGVFDEKHYQDLEGGLPEGMGKLLDDNTKLYVYPHKTPLTCMTAKLYRPVAPVDRIYDFFFKKGQITDIAGCDESLEYKHSDEVRRKIEKKDKSWERDVPPQAVDWIKKRRPWATA